MFVELISRKRDDVHRIAGCLRDVILKRGFERAFDAKKMVEELGVWAVIDTFIGGELRLVC